MRVPEIIRKKLEMIKAKKQQQVDAAVSSEKRKEREEREFEAWREERRAESEGYAKKICRWIRQFAMTDECREILGLRGAVQISSADFWLGHPAPGSVTTCAVIELRYQKQNLAPCVYYVEKHKGMESRENFLSYAEEIGVDGLVSSLHPDFLKQWAGEIKRGKVWEDVENSLR